jgi:hypothetical protein
MMRLIVLLALTLALGACDSNHKLTECRGSFAAANPGKWQPTSADLSK